MTAEDWPCFVTPCQITALYQNLNLVNGVCFGPRPGPCPRQVLLTLLAPPGLSLLWTAVRRTLDLRREVSCRRSQGLYLRYYL